MFRMPDILDICILGSSGGLQHAGGQAEHGHGAGRGRARVVGAQGQQRTNGTGQK